VRATVGRRVPPLRCMHLRGILWVFIRVLLVSFSLFRLGVARALKVNILVNILIRGNLLAYY